jgi:H/ACA ribonucleoprotein complex subunit 2
MSAPKRMRNDDGVSIIAVPLAEDKLLKKTLKLVKKASKAKKIRRGVREVQKALRKKQRGLCVIAGDISPIDVISHLSGLCEDKDIPYIYVPSKADLGAAGATKRPTSCVMIVPGEGWEEAEAYDELQTKVKAALPKL